MSASSAFRDDQRVPDPCRQCDLSNDGSCPQHPAPKLSRRAADEYIDSKRARYEVKKHLSEISPRTIDRRLNELGAPRPHSTARPRGRRRGNYEASLPVRKWWEWDNEPPGSVIADHVYHSGSATGGAHCYTLTVVDAATSWTSLRAIERLEKDLVVSSMDLAYRSWPLPIHAVHTDHGTEFANDTFGGWVGRKGIEHTLGRPRQSNDQARVEQRNNTAVRLELADYRFTGRVACKALNDYYTVYRLYLNFFRPVRKLAARGPNREKPPSRFLEPATPYELMLASGTLDAEATERLARIYEALDPVRLNEQIDQLLRRVMHYAG